MATMGQRCAKQLEDAGKFAKWLFKKSDEEIKAFIESRDDRGRFEVTKKRVSKLNVKRKG